MSKFVKLREIRLLLVKSLILIIKIVNHKFIKKLMNLKMKIKLTHNSVHLTKSTRINSILDLKRIIKLL